MTTLQAMITVAVVAGCTFAIRLVPFALFGRGSEPPKVINYVGDIMPPLMMAILIIYCVRNIDFTNVIGWMPMLIAIVFTALLHVWRRNNLLSIAGGTVFYMLLIQNVFQ